MLVYLAAPYSRFPDKARLMRALMEFAGEYMIQHPGVHLVSPLFNHYALELVPALGTDYPFWSEYSRDLLSRCDELLVLRIRGWEQSTGVQDEMKHASDLGIPIELHTIEIY